MLQYLDVITHKRIPMRSALVPFPTLLAGFVAVLVGYASSAAIIWQAAAAAGAMFVYQGRHRAVLINYPDELFLDHLFSEVTAP